MLEGICCAGEAAQTALHSSALPCCPALEVPARDQLHKQHGCQKIYSIMICVQKCLAFTCTSRVSFACCCHSDVTVHCCSNLVLSWRVGCFGNRTGLGITSYPVVWVVAVIRQYGPFAEQGSLRRPRAEVIGCCNSACDRDCVVNTLQPGDTDHPVDVSVVECTPRTY